MPIPRNKKELIEEIIEHYHRLINELNSIPPERRLEKSMEGHAKNSLMSPQELIAYLIGWGQLVLKWNRLKTSGIEPDFPDTGYKWNELGKLAQHFYTEHGNSDFESLLNKLEITTNEIIQIIELQTNEELYDKPWYGKWTLGRMIQLNTSSPFKNARLRIRKWKKNFD